MGRLSARGSAPGGEARPARFLPWNWSIRGRLLASFCVTMLLILLASREGVSIMHASQETMDLVESRYAREVRETQALTRATEGIDNLAHALANATDAAGARALKDRIAARLEELPTLLGRLSGSEITDDWVLKRIGNEARSLETTLNLLVATVEASIAAAEQRRRLNTALIDAHGEVERAIDARLAEAYREMDSAARAAVPTTPEAALRDGLAALLRGRATLGPAAPTDLPVPGVAGLLSAARAVPSWLVAGTREASVLASVLGRLRALLAEARRPAPAGPMPGMTDRHERISTLLEIRADVNTALGMQLSAAGAQGIAELETYLPRFGIAKAGLQDGLLRLSARTTMPRLHAAALRLLALGGETSVFAARRAELDRQAERARLVEALQTGSAAIAADVSLLSTAAGAGATLAVSALAGRLEDGRRRILLLAALAFVASGLIALAIMRSVSQPLVALTRLMRDIAGGRYELGIPYRARLDELGEMARALEVFADAMRDLARSRDELRRTALSDPLTGLPNRRGLGAFLREIARAPLTDKAIAVMHVDLDRFKAVNDTLGHAAGDHVLLHAAGILGGAVRKGDMVARVGGDEFVVVCRGMDGREAAGALAGRLIEGLCEPVPYGDRICRIGASIGIAFWRPEEEQDAERPLTDADIALYDAKGAGRGGFRFFEEAMRARVEAGVEVAQEIRDGIRRDEFEPFLQPQIDLRSGLVTGYEALIRWRHPRRGLLGPAEFLPCAAEAGLLDRLDERMLVLACAALRRLAKAGLPAGQVGVNLSASRLAAHGVVDSVKWTVDSMGLTPDQLGIEVLESVLLDETAGLAAENIRRFAEAGFPIELDDFGTGHAAISNLRDFPVDRIKIDRDFVSGIDRDPELVMMTGAIAGMGRSLGLGVLAEGVETEAELAVLRRLGCHSAQGFLIARPMPVAELERWLRGAGQMPLRPLLDRLDEEDRRNFG